MKRREFLALGAGAAASSAIDTTSAAEPARAATAARRQPEGPAVLTSYSDAEHRKRLENIAFLQRSVRKCLRKHLVTDYLPGQCCYNLGEYPSVKPWDPDATDERELDALRDQGIRLIQIHEEWNDSQRLFGADKLSAVNPQGLRRFVDMVHHRGMKVILYVSSGYFERTDRDFKPQWATPHDLREIYFRYAHCSPVSPGWRAYFLPRLARILEDYGADGIYNDLGYVQPGPKPPQQSADQVPAFDESPTHDGALTDLLGLVYAEVKRRGGIVKIHRGGTRAPLTDVRVYDYLWVGEGGRDGDRMRDQIKNHDPYVVPCLDMSRAKIDREDDLYLQAIPYMQFPLLLAGRPFTGQRALVPGIQYPPEEKCFWTRHCRAIWKHHQEHPEGPHSYGWWDSVPGRPEARATHTRWLRRYLPLVEEGTWAWLEVSDSDLFAEPLPAGVVASAFANRQTYLALANYSSEPVQVRTNGAYRLAEDSAGPGGRNWALPGRTLQVLSRAAG